MFALFKKPYTKTMFVPKSGFLPLVYWLANLNLTDKHDTKN